MDDGIDVTGPLLSWTALAFRSCANSVTQQGEAILLEDRDRKMKRNTDSVSHVTIMVETAVKMISSASAGVAPVCTERASTTGPKYSRLARYMAWA